MVAIVATILAVIMGQLVNGLSSFFTPLEAAFGWTRADIALINTAGLVGLAIGGIGMGVLADRIGVRAVSLVGVAVSAACFAAASAAQSLWQLYALFFVAGALGGGAVFGPLIALTGRWFTTGAGLALGLVAAGQAIGQGAVPVFNVLMIEALGWRGALFSYGAITAVGLLPLAFMLKSPPPAAVAAQAHASRNNARFGLVVALMSVAVFWCCTLMSIPLVHLLPLIEACGIPSAQAGGAVFVMMLAAIGGRVAFGRVADMIGPVQAWFVASLWQTSLVFGFTGIGSLPLFLAFAPIYGFGYAGVMTAILASLKSLTPPESRASATGIVIAFAWVGHGFGGYSGGAIFDWTLNYTAAFGFAAVAGLVNLCIVGTLWVMTSTPREAGLAA
jgi:MFS family permease